MIENNDNYVTTHRAAKLAGVSQVVVQRYAKEGQLPGTIKMANIYFIPRESVLKIAEIRQQTKQGMRERGKRAAAYMRQMKAQKFQSRKAANAETLDRIEAKLDALLSAWQIPGRDSNGSGQN